MTGFGIVLVALHALAASASRGPTVSAKKACAPRLNKTSMLQRSAMARSLAQAKRPDPTCKTGVVSLAGAVADRPQACCPAYCGECSDYPECDKVRGQDSANACCLSKVLDLECGGPAKPPANVCLKKCVDAVPPCIMEEGVAFEMPSVTSAAEDCNEAVGEWMDKAESAVKSGKGGAASWDSLEAAGKIYELAQNSSKKITVTPKKCSPRLNKTSMLQRSTLFKSFVAAKRPDPTCKTGVVSLAGAVADRPQACCPAYCGECSDYPECDKVRGQDSANACCLSKVLDLECGGPAKPPANVCLKKCVDAVPPCIMEEGVAFEMPSVTSAAEDCNEAVGEWMDKAESAVKSGKGGAASWDSLEAAGKIYELAQNGTKKQTVKANLRGQKPKKAKKCPPRLNKTSMIQRSVLFRSLVETKKPDPTCKTGVLSLAGAIADKPQACCPAYCGECSDYAACASVKGQDSANACCLSKVLDLECGGPAKTPANACLKKCVDGVPPCIMAEGEVFEMPEVTSAAEDCNEAVGEWMDGVEAAVKAAEGGDEAWEALQKAGKIYLQNGTKKETIKEHVQKK